MSNEISINFDTGVDLYVLVRDAHQNIWNVLTSAFEVFNGANYSHYVVSLTEQVGQGGFYTGDFPSLITAGYYTMTCRQALGGSGNEAVGDLFIGIENFQWDGSNPFPLSELALASTVNQGFPQRIGRGTMVENVPLYFKSSIDHVTPMLSGVCSGQIIRNSGVWGPLQSGEFVNQGQGFYNLKSLTSGDLLANTVKLLFTCKDVSGATADPVAMGLILNRSSGQ